MIKFSKMHGLGNNYIYLNCLESEPDNPNELARKVSDPNFGIGSDGLVMILPSEKEDYRMRIFNLDGGEAEMCGNAVRCVAKYLYEKGITDKTEISLETLGGKRVLYFEPDQSNQVKTLTADMGIPSLDPSTVADTNLLKDPYTIAGHEFKITCVSVGNPHVVIFVPEITDHLVLEVGPQIENDPTFPAKTNVEFAKIISPNEIEMRVWERGSGETWACGTAASATLVAAVVNELSERTVTLKLLGGDLHVDWRADDHVYNTGPAEFICDGVFYENGN